MNVMLIEIEKHLCVASVWQICCQPHIEPAVCQSLSSTGIWKGQCFIKIYLEVFLLSWTETKGEGIWQRSVCRNHSCMVVYCTCLHGSKRPCLQQGVCRGTVGAVFTDKMVHCSFVMKLHLCFRLLRTIPIANPSRKKTISPKSNQCMLSFAYFTLLYNFNLVHIQYKSTDN